VAAIEIEPARLARRGIALLAALAALLFRPPVARADDHVTGSVLYYHDSDKVTVVSPRLAASVDVGQATIGVQSSVDVISAASVDLVSAASPRGFTEQRVEVDGSAAYHFGEGRDAEVFGGVSREPDFVNTSVGVRGTYDVLDRRATLGAGYAFGHASIGRTDDTAFSRTRVQHQGELSLSPILSRTTVLDLVYELAVLDGFQANPYRFVRLYAPGAAHHATAVPERVPEERARHAAVVRVRHRIAQPLFGQLEYRFYADSWGLVAQTLAARATVSLFHDAVHVAFEGRGYTQGEASFYRRRYETFPDAPDLRTADKELGRMVTLLGGGHVEWGRRLGRLDALRLGAGLDALHMRYLDYALLSSRTALLFSADATVVF
jgi:hypothetical protein